MYSFQTIEKANIDHSYQLNCGQWFITKKGKIVIACPDCGKLQAIHIGKWQYKIYEGGEVEPIFVCKRLTCDFMDHIKLLNWDSSLILGSS